MSADQEMRRLRSFLNKLIDSVFHQGDNIFLCIMDTIAHGIVEFLTGLPVTKIIYKAFKYNWGWFLRCLENLLKRLSKQ